MPHPASNAGLRSRKIDLKKALTVYRATDIPDLDESSAIARNLHNISTGVEKEEEEEHHLQAALHANQVGVQHAAVIIPTPDASKAFPNFVKYYSNDYVQPKSLIKFSSQLDECIGCPYNMDEKDDKFLAEYNAKNNLKLSETEFEGLIWSMEQVANEKLNRECPKIEEIHAYIDVEAPFLNEKKACIPLVLDWWKLRRFDERKGEMIIPQLKYEEGIKQDDPYVCFRKRDIKSLRKRGRNDGQSIEKLNRLRSEIYRAKQILELVVQRETLRKEALVMERTVFEKRVVIRRMKKKLGIVEQEPSPDKIRKRLKRDGFGLTKIKIPIHKLRDAAQILSDSELRLQLEGGQLSPFLEALQMDERAKKKCASEKSQGWIDTTEDPYHPYPSPTYSNDIWTTDFSEQTLQSKDSFLNSFCGRRRIGRNGRVWIDQHYKTKDLINAFGEDPTEKFKFCSSDDEIQQDWCIDQVSIPWRAFNLCATTDQECRSLINRPTYPDQINPTPNLTMVKSEIVPPQVVRQPQQTASVQPTKKKAQKVSTDTTKSSVKKKSSEPLDPRTATIKAMMQQAQKQAQMNQGVKSGNGSASNSVPGTPVQQSSSLVHPDSPKQETPKTSPKQTLPDTPKQSMNKAAVSQNARLQQMRMQAPTGMIPGVPIPPQLANLNPQQLMYLNSQSLMNAMASQAAAIQSRMRFPGNPSAQMAMMGANNQMAALQAQLQLQNSNANMNSNALQQQLLQNKLQNGVPNPLAAALALQQTTDASQLLGQLNSMATKPDIKKEKDQK